MRDLSFALYKVNQSLLTKTFKYISLSKVINLPSVWWKGSIKWKKIEKLVKKKYLKMNNPLGLYLYIID